PDQRRLRPDPPGRVLHEVAMSTPFSFRRSRHCCVQVDDAHGGLMKVFALPILYVALSASTALGQVPVMLPEFQVSTTPPGFDYGVDSADSVAIGDDGRFIVTWSNPYGANSGCLQRSYNPFGNAESLPTPISSAGSGWLSDVARDASGRYVIVWMGGDDKIWGRRFDSDG